MNVTVLFFGIFGIYLGGNWLVAGASRLGRAFGLPPVLVGLTIISTVTAAPEVLIGIRAAQSGADGLVLGTVIGSNITNIGLILGLSGLIAGALPIATGLVRRGVPVMVGLTLVVYGMTFLGALNWIMGIVMLVLFIFFVVYMLRMLRQDDTVQAMATQEMMSISPIETGDMLLVEDDEIVEREITDHINRNFEFVRTIAGILLLIYSSDFLVQASLILVEQLGTNELILGATFVALVTSAPELIAVMSAALRGQPDVAFGNLIGSSMTNVLVVLGLSALVSPLIVASQVRVYAFPVMLVLMLYMIVVALDGVLSRFEAAMYTIAYAAFIAGLFLLPIF
ncbi:MAG: sodium:calcium antiporter [Chloroflexota bacterium]